MRYLIYAAVAALVVWSVVCLWWNLRSQIKGECDGRCGDCSHGHSSHCDNPSRKTSASAEDAKPDGNPHDN